MADTTISTKGTWISINLNGSITDYNDIYISIRGLSTIIPMSHFTSTSVNNTVGLMIDYTGNDNNKVMCAYNSSTSINVFVGSNVTATMIPAVVYCR